jgi:hypothetical protein
MPKKDKRTKPDLTQRHWFKDEVCTWMRWSDETLRRKMRDKGFPPAIEEVGGKTRIDRNGNIIRCYKARWIVAEVLQWEAANMLSQQPANDNISPEDRRKLIRFVDDE